MFNIFYEILYYTVHRALEQKLYSNYFAMRVVDRKSNSDICGFAKVQSTLKSLARTLVFLLLHLEPVVGR